MKCQQAKRTCSAGTAAVLYPEITEAGCPVCFGTGVLFLHHYKKNLRFSFWILCKKKWFPFFLSVKSPFFIRFETH